MLRPVAVMNVPVDNQNPFGTVFFLRVTGPDRHIIKKTKAQSLISLCMMSWRTQQTKTIPGFLTKDRVN